MFKAQGKAGENNIRGGISSSRSQVRKNYVGCKTRERYDVLKNSHASGRESKNNRRSLADFNNVRVRFNLLSWEKIIENHQCEMQRNVPLLKMCPRKHGPTTFFTILTLIKVVIMENEGGGSL